MKIRPGFISNSSTSSFIVKGILIDNKYYDEVITILKEHFSNFRVANPQDYDELELQYEFKRYLRDNSILFADSVEDGCPTDTCIMFGELLYDNDRSDLPDATFDLNLSENVKQIKSVIEQKTGQELSEKLIIGTRCC